jgi:hypothetical protein
MRAIIVTVEVADFDDLKCCDGMTGHRNRSPSCPISITQPSSLPAAMSAASAITHCGPTPRICAPSRASPGNITLPIPCQKDDILAYHRHLRDELDAKPATIERRLITLKSYFA